LGDGDQHEDLMPKASNKTTGPCDFRADNLCMIANFASIGVGQPFEVVTSTKEDG